MTSRHYALGLAMLLLYGCSNTDNLVVVIPDSNGHVGEVAVHSGGTTTFLNSAYAAVGSGAGSGTMKSVEVDSGEVNKIFGPALAAQPIPPKSYVLHFVSDSDTLTPESLASFKDVFAEIARRKAAEIVVTGHTDLYGTDEYNDALSLARANTVRDLLIRNGLSGATVLAVGRGKRELLSTEVDEAHQAQNRRVQITVR